MIRTDHLCSSSVLNMHFNEQWHDYHVVFVVCCVGQDQDCLHWQDEQGLTPLHTAAEVGNEELGSLLLDQGADVSNTGRDDRHITALHVATYHNQDHMVKLLLEKGVDVNVQDANGHTALHVAALLNRAKLIPLLLHAGSDVKLIDKHNKTAEQLAYDKSSDEVIRQFDVLKL